VALQRLAEVFDAAGALDRLEDFTSKFGARFYGEVPNEGTVTLVRDTAETPPPCQTPSGTVTVFDPGWPLQWSIAR
jgi:dihydroorotase